MTSEEEKQISITDPSLALGIVQQVGHSNLTCMLSAPEGATAKGNIGSYVVIPCNKQTALYGKIIDIRTAAVDTIGSEQKQVVPVANVELMTTIDFVEGKPSFTPGVATHPDNGSIVYAAHPKLIKKVSENAQGTPGENAVQLRLAKLFRAGDSEITFTPERVFGRHCAILGTSGGGKSWSLSRFVGECGKHSSKVIVFDATGEFYTLKGGVRHVYLGHDPSPRGGSIPVSLPYYQLKESDLFAIFRPTGQSQPSKLRAAMKTLKLLQLAPHLGYGGTFVKAHKEKVHYEQEYKRYYSDIEDPFARFDIRRLSQQIENECVYPNRGTNESTSWGGPNGQEHGDCIGLINRINDILKGTDLAPVFYPDDKPSLLDEIEDFLADPKARVLRVSLQFLSFAYGAREIVANAIGRRLLEMGRDSKFKKNPLLIFLDEAHQFLNSTLVTSESANPLDSFALIAKEGRKYSLTICLSTQRPRDIPEGVLSQIGTLFVHRLVNDADRNVVERASGDMQASSLALLPSLAPGEAIVFGVDYPIPLSIQMLPPDDKPDSRGPDFQTFWSKQ
jgi:hypothetical protein